MKKWTLILVAVCTVFRVYAQQDAQTTQYIFNGLYINPAYAGYKQEVYVQSFYRAQWTGLKGAPRSFSVAADGAVSDGSVGLGLTVSSDQLGAQSYLSAYANYAYKIRIGFNEHSKLSFGLAAGFVQLGLDVNKLNSIDQEDAAIATSQMRTVPDARFGIYYANDRYFAGVSATNLLARYMAKKGETSLMVPVPQPHIFFTTGAYFQLTEEAGLKPVIMLKDDLKGPTSLDINAFFLIKEKVWIGVAYRTSVSIYNKPHLQDHLSKPSALAGILELFPTQNLRLGYSYDYDLNKLKSYTYGSHEISAGIYLNRRNPNRDRQLRCYDF